jgi:hypothetical protein
MFAAEQILGRKAWRASTTREAQNASLPAPADRPSKEAATWLFSRRADFWLACGGASGAVLAAILLIFLRGDRELDALDFVLSEFHLGATYDAVLRRRLWRHRRVDVLIVPLAIVALTYALSLSGQTILLTSIAMYAAVWHRGRQSLGVARFYQRETGGPVSSLHDCLFRGAIYLPMFAGMIAYTHLAPSDYEGQPYFALNCGAEITSLIGFVAAIWVIAYFVFMLFQTHNGWLLRPHQTRGLLVHPGEYWVVLAHAVAFGSGYILGALNPSFLLVLAVHHEVQYLYFTYAMARRPKSFRAAIAGAIDPAMKDLDSRTLSGDGRGLRTELRHAASFIVWPVMSFVGATVGGWCQLDWLAPLGMGGLFCHYWLDGRIWTRRSFQN